MMHQEEDSTLIHENATRESKSKKGRIRTRVMVASVDG